MSSGFSVVGSRELLKSDVGCVVCLDWHFGQRFTAEPSVRVAFVYIVYSSLSVVVPSKFWWLWAIWRVIIQDTEVESSCVYWLYVQGFFLFLIRIYIAVSGQTRSIFFLGEFHKIIFTICFVEINVGVTFWSNLCYQTTYIRIDWSISGTCLNMWKRISLGCESSLITGKYELSI